VGAKKGSTVVVETPKGAVSMKILDVYKA